MVKKIKTPETSAPIEVELTAHDEAVAHFKETVQAIQEDYLIEDDAVMEMNAAVDKLLVKISEENETVSNEFEEEPLKVAAIQVAMQNGEIEADDLLDLLDTADMASHIASADNYFIVRVDTMANRDKLSEFVKSEIYPHYNDQKEYLFD